MKFVTTGSVGNISKPLAHQSLREGREVFAGRSAHKLAGLFTRGAEAAIGNLNKVAFLRS
ncbi:hypothetical protein B5K03_34280 [Rhizobium phaseoli]|nr:hypothetical protein B5K03_34280 [Rhizobium phaseoli]